MKTHVPIAVGNRLVRRLLSGFSEYPALFSRVIQLATLSRRRLEKLPLTEHGGGSVAA